MAQNEEILKGRFISRILREEGQNIEQAKQKVVSTFASRNLYNATYTNTDSVLTMTHPKQLRFIDMKHRKTKNGGRIRKKSHPVHNKILFGHANNIVRRISFEYTSGMKETLLREFDHSQ